MQRMIASTAMALLLAACGASSGPGSPHPAQVQATVGNLQVTAAPARPQPGETVTVNLDVTGPADYEAACVQTLHIWAVDASGRQVWEQPVPEIQCMAIASKHLGDGEIAHFQAQWPVASGTTAGAYSVHGLFLYTLRPGAGTRVRENLPVVAIQVG
jgi:hypothetical protein